MPDLYVVFNQVATAPDSGPAASLALSVCRLRGVDPYGYVNTDWGVLCHWRAVIFECALIELLKMESGR